MSFELVETERVERTLLERKDIKVKLNFFWNSHGKFIKFTYNDKYSLSRVKADVKIIRVDRKLNDIDFTNWELTISGVNDVFECVGYSFNPGTNTLNAKIVVGWG